MKETFNRLDAGVTNGAECGGWDSNPRTPRRQEPRSLGIELNGFNEWLEEKDCSSVHKESIRRYISKIPLSFSSPSHLTKFLRTARPSRHYVIAIANYLMYVKEDGEDYQEYRDVLKFEKTKPDLNIPSDHKVRDVITKLHEPYRTFGMLLAYSGLRLTESLELVTHLDSNRMIERGDVTVYPLGMMRGSKNAFYTYMPKSLAQDLEGLGQFSSYKETGKKFRIAGLPAKYLRKWNYNILVRAGIDMMIAEFIQGRAFRIIGGTNYLGAMERATEAYTKALPLIESIIPSKNHA